MVAMKLNRVNLNELERLVLTCSECGANVVVDVTQVKKNITACPVCGYFFPETVTEAVGFLRKAHLAIRGDDKAKIEFDVITE